MAIEIQLTHDAADLDNLQTEWETLHNNSRSDSLFCTWAWMTHWFHYGGHNDAVLWLFTARDDGTLVGVAPLMLVHHDEARGVGWRQLEFLSASAPVDHWDFIVESGREPDVTPALLNEIKRYGGKYDVLELRNILPDSPNLPYIRAAGIPWEETDGHMTPRLPLPDDFDAYFENTLSGNKRQKQRRYVRKVNKEYGEDGWRFEVIEDAERVEPAMQTMMTHHQAKWEALGEPGAFGTPEQVAFHMGLAKKFFERGWLRLYQLTFGDEVAGVVYAFSYRGRVYYFNSGMNYALDKLQPGHIIHEMIIRDSIARGEREYDFMWGDEQYKFSWGAQESTDRVFTWYATVRAKLVKNAIDLARAGKAKLKQMQQTDENTDNA